MSDVDVSAAGSGADLPPAGPFPYLTSLLTTALAAGVFAVLFRGAITGSLRLITGFGDIVAAMHSLPWAARLLLPAAGGLLAGLCSLAVAKQASGRGVGDVMEAV